VIVVDTSAIIAVILNEESSQRVSEAIAQSDACTISPVTLTEATMVLSRTVHDPKLVLDSYLHTLGIEICAIDSAQAELATNWSNTEVSVAGAAAISPSALVDTCA